MAKQALDIHAPVLGVDRRLAFQSQPPYTCAGALNYWPRDRFERRMRGGDRPGLQKAFLTGVTGPVHLLANVRVIEEGAVANVTSYTEQFLTSEWGSQWSVMEWVNAEDQFIRRDGQCRLYSNVAVSDRQSGMVLDSLDANTTKDIIVQLHIDYMGVWHIPYAHTEYWQPYGRFHIYVGLGDVYPKLEPGIVRIELEHQGTIGTLTCSYMNSSLTWVNEKTALSFAAFPKTLQVILDETADQARVYVGGLPAYVVFDISAGAGAPARPGQRVGFAVYTDASPDPTRIWYQRLNYFNVAYTTPTYEAIPNRNMVIAAGGTNAVNSRLDIRYEKTLNTLTAFGDVNAATVNDDGRQLQAAELLGRLYIVGEKAKQPWCCCLSETGRIGTIAQIHAAEGLFAFDPEPEGTPPSGCTWICAWNNRLVCGGDWTDPQNAYMSKFNEPQNWTYGSLVGSATKLNTTGIDTGKLGEPINAGIPTSDDYLILGCLNSLYVLRGDPTLGGKMDRLSASIGIVAAQAWARGPDGESVLLSQDGLYGIPPGITNYPQSISRERLPQELRDIDTHNYRILLAYDVHNRGVFIGITPIFGSGGTYFWLDWEARGFWPMEFNPSFEPTALVYRNADASLDQRLLFGCRDGHIRTLNAQAFTDDGVDYKSELLIGPIALGGGGYNDGMLLEVIGQLGAGSGDINCGVKVGKSVEDAYNSDERSKFTLRAGKNLTQRPRLRGNAAYIRLSSDGGTGWALENMTLARQKLGKQRLS